VTRDVSAATLVEGATHRGRSRLVFTALTLLCIAVVYVVSIVRIHPTYLFGLTEDDGIYLSSAKALAEGRGYILPYLPGSPPATKYPILYPWMLSLVWRWNPSFPANLPLAISLSVAFGIAFLMAAFAFFSGPGGLSRKEALILTGFLAVHPLVMFFGASVLSEMPFAFFALASMSIADGALRPGGKLSRGAASGILAGLAALTRVLGFSDHRGHFRYGSCAPFVASGSNVQPVGCSICRDSRVERYFLEEASISNQWSCASKSRMGPRLDLLYRLRRNVEIKRAGRELVLADVEEQRRNASSAAGGFAVRTNLCSRLHARPHTRNDGRRCDDCWNCPPRARTWPEANSHKSGILYANFASLELSRRESIPFAFLAVGVWRSVDRGKKANAGRQIGIFEV
jgi:hypothetical protein